MNIVHLVPGSGGGFYCQNCLRDHALIKALRRLNHQAVLVPMYLPILAEDSGIHNGVPVFYGAINLYLQQKLPFFRRTPRWLTAMLDSPRLLRWAARKAGSTRARGLEDMTLAMLRADQTHQVLELERLIAWLAAGDRPDVIHFSNLLLLGLAQRIKNELKVPIVCSVQDEDTWIDAMEPGAAGQAWDILAEKAAAVDLFIGASRYYAEVIRTRLGLGAERIRVVPVGIDLEGRVPGPLSFDPPTVGFLSRMAESLGLGLLIDAFLILKRDPRLRGLKLRATGGQTADDRRFLAGQRRKLAARGCVDDVEFLAEFSVARRGEFLRSLSVLSVPAPKGEAFGTYLIEAWAEGVPVVQPKLGAYPELLEATGGGLLYEPNNAEALASALAALLLDPDRARQLGQQGRRAVAERFDIETAARQLAAIYTGLRPLES